MTRPNPFRPVLLAVVLGAGALLACDNSNNGDTINVNGLDCGLIRSDLLGTWTVTFTPAARTLQNCGGVSPAQSGTSFTVVAGTVNYTVSQPIASPTGAAFTALGTGPNNKADELIVSIEADSCLALVQVWQNAEGGWVQCLGTADRVSRLIQTVCDSVDLDTDSTPGADTACDLNGSITATIGLP
jgi:hypothetical protein